jgi:hypothetical protein
MAHETSRGALKAWTPHEFGDESVHQLVEVLDKGRDLISGIAEDLARHLRTQGLVFDGCAWQSEETLHQRRRVDD